LLSDLAWKSGRQADVLQHLEQARSLVAGTLPSRAHVSVLSSVVRYTMLADDNESTIELGRQALSMAEQLGLDVYRANLLNSIGTARAALGDREGLVTIEQSIDLALKANSINDVLRGHNNLVPMTMLYGDVEEGFRRAAETLRLARHYGHNGFARFMEGGAMVATQYHLGRWEQALEYAEPFLASVEEGSPHYQSASAYCFRGLIRLGRGDNAGAVKDAERGAELARGIGDPQALHSVLAMASFIFGLTENDRRARETVREALDAFRGLHHVGFVAVEMHHLAWAAREVGAEDELLPVIARWPFRSLWAQVAEAVAGGDFRGAAGVVALTGAVNSEAFYRLRAAAQLVDEGRRAEADEQLRPALAFYRSVGATRYVREGEALLAASA
jgi:tetratricopeptide (TPR) repeat protein